MTKKIRKKKNVKSSADLIEELLLDEEGPDGIELNSLSTTSGPLNERYILEQLHTLANKGNVKALELLGRHFEIFDKNKGGSELFDIFVDEGTLEENILKFVDILTDKYSDELKDSLNILLNTEDLYIDEKEKRLKEQRLLRQLKAQHEANHKDPSEELQSRLLPTPNPDPETSNPGSFDTLNPLKAK